MTSHSSDQTQSSRNDYDPHLVATIEKAVTVSFDQFLDFAFDFRDSHWRDADSSYSQIAATCNKYLVQYAAEVSHETQRYHEFNKLANHILTTLHKEPSIVICRNDRVPIIGSRRSSAERIPDCVIIQPMGLKRGNRISWENLSKEGPKDDPFHWAELLGFVEFYLEELALDASAVDDNPVSNETSAAASTSGSKDKKRPTWRTYDDDTPQDRYGVLIQCASYAREMFSNGGFRSHVFGMLITDDKVELLYYDHSLAILSEPFYFLQDPTSLVLVLACMEKMSLGMWGHIIEPTNLYAPS